MARGRGGRGKKQDKSNKLRRRKFSKNAFKRPPADKKKRGSSSNRGARPRRKELGGQGEWHEGGPTASSKPAPVVRQQIESDSESEREENPLDQLMSSFGVAKAVAVSSDDELTSSESDDDELLDDEEDGEIPSDDDDAEASDDDATAENVDDDGGDSEKADSEMDETDIEVTKEAETDAEEAINANADEPDLSSDSDEEPEDASEEDRRDDPFCRHFGKFLDPKVVLAMGDQKSWLVTKHKWKSFGAFTWKRLTSSDSSSSAKSPPDAANDREASLQCLLVHAQLHAGWKTSNASRAFGGEQLSPLQREIFSVANSYTDLLFYGRSHQNSESLRAVYCLHALNHVLKTRAAIRRNNARLLKCDDVPEECRDQGLTRPKVLILLPFRESALRVVQSLAAILSPDQRANVLNKKRFQDEFGGVKDDEEEDVGDVASKPLDHRATFAGNIDDGFSLGVSVTRKTLRLYADFYSSDIIVASPLALRMAIGADGDKRRDHDFLSSVELLVVDQADVMLMQNWDHVLHVLRHLHLQPRDAHDVDFSRVRPWVLEGWGGSYRQTLLFTSFVSAEVNALFTKHCSNYAGLVRTVNVEDGGAIQQVVVQIPQVFQRFQSSSPSGDPEARFKYFVDRVMPQFKESVMSRTLVYVASYFDFVRLRNHMRQQEISHVQISEYHSSSKVKEARKRLVGSRVQFALYTERAHFYNRYAIKGIHHVIFYQLPSFPHFYSEICNLTQLQTTRDTREITCTVMYSRYDSHRLAAVVGTDRTAQMLSTDNNVHLMVTGETKRL